MKKHSENTGITQGLGVILNTKPCGSRRTRSFVFTLNNYTETDYNHINTLTHQNRKPKIEKLIVGKEVAPTTGTIHLQGYVKFANPQPNDLKAFKGVCKLFEPKGTTENHRIKWAVATGSPAANWDYCHKEGDYFEHGFTENERNCTHEDCKACMETQKIVEQRQALNEAIFDRWLKGCSSGTPGLYHNYEADDERYGYYENEPYDDDKYWSE